MMNENNFQLQLTETKRLRSGKCQVKFYIRRDNSYGYALVDSSATLREVVSGICENYNHLKSGPFLPDRRRKVGSGMQNFNFVLIQK
jgi:hypothetical protein